MDEHTIERAAKLIMGEASDEKGLRFEIELLNEADSLDEGGVLYVWRMFSYSIHHMRTIDGLLEYYKLTETKQKAGEWIRRFSIPEIRKVARRRNLEMDKVMKEFEKEHKSKDI